MGKLSKSGKVSIHAPARGATYFLPDTISIYICFNPRPCARGDCLTSLHHSSILSFQSTPLREGRHGGLIMKHGRKPFQSTPLREGRRTLVTCIGSTLVFQSTPLREGRLCFIPGHIIAGTVSIHAPARGATESPQFQHA